MEKTSIDYAKFCDIYPKEFYQKMIDRKLCLDGQFILDIGTRIGVPPRNMYQFGAKWTGTDISENQIEHAKILSKGMDMDYYTVSTEDINFPDNSFDVITACQCLFISTMKLLCLNFIVCLSKGEVFLFHIWRGYHVKIGLQVPFTHESWKRRMKACRGIGASLTEKEIFMWEQEHKNLFEHIVPKEFDILHYGAIAELRQIHV